MSDSNQKKPEEIINNMDENPVSESRRKLTKAGIVAPVLLALSNRPAWAGGCAPSAFFSSTHTSHRPDAYLPCVKQGYSPGYWKNDGGQSTHTWPDPFKKDSRVTQRRSRRRPDAVETEIPEDAYRVGGNEYRIPDGTNFRDTFHAGQDKTLFQVLWSSSDRSAIEFHAVAAVLNAESGMLSLTTYEVKNIFNSLLTKGYWESAIGQLYWDRGEFQLKEYFDNYL